ncbi:MAG: hypothetical protein AB1491_05965 [Thermodesulfobacteriota bacterium]
MIWTAAVWGVICAREPFTTWLYHFAWWPLLLFLDGLLYLLKGESWLLSRPRELARLLAWSVTAWLFFEVYNLVLGNWRYVGMEPNFWLRWPGYALAFATVLPGILLTSQVLAALGAYQGVRGPGRDLGLWQPLFLILGVASALLPLVLPRYAFPLIWLAFIFLLDPVLDLLDGESLTRRFAAGERQELLSLLTAGLLCGFWWEMWNYPARAKWIYTLPVFNFWKVFEMPLLGYLGFLPFALEAAVMYNFLNVLEKRYIIRPRQRRLFWLVQVAFWLAAFWAIDTWTVLSCR